MKKTYFWLLLILVLGAALRFYQLGSVPHGVTQDEMGYIFNSYSIAKTGKNLLGQPYPFLTYLYGNGFPFMPVTTYLSVLVFKIMPLSAFAGRFINALFGTSSIVLIYFLAKYLLKKESIALLAAASLAVMPWQIFWSRTAYDILVAEFFYLAAVTAFLIETNKKRLPLISVACFLLAMFSYRGMTPISLPLILLLFWYGAYILKLKAKVIGIFILGSIVTVSFFAFTAFANKSRGFISETNIDFGKIAWDIELLRRDTLGPEKLKQLFINKPMYLLNVYTDHYLNGYAPGHLFLYGEANQIYTISDRGELYLVDLIFILAAVYFLLRARTEKGAAGFIFGMFAIAGLPAVFLGEPYSSRDLFMSIPLAVLVAVGIDGLIHLKSRGWILGIVIFITYLYSVPHYLYDYFLRYNYQQASVWVSDMKQVSGLLQAGTGQNEKAVLAGTSFVDLLQYAFYSKADPVLVQAAWRNQKDGVIQFELINVGFSRSCAKAHKLNDFINIKVYSLVIARPECFDKEIPSLVIRDFSRNPIWKVYPVNHQ